MKNPILGFGMRGIVYETKQGDALKIQQITPDQREKSVNSEIWRSIRATQVMNKIYPLFFPELKKIEFVENCKHTHTEIYKQSAYYNWLSESQKEFYSKLFSSDLCVYLTMEKIDFTFLDILKKSVKLSKNELRSLFIQLYYAIEIMWKNDIRHRDLTPGNIGVSFTKIEELTIHSKKIKTFGYLIKIIDFDLVSSVKMGGVPEDKTRKDTLLPLYTFYSNYLTGKLEQKCVKIPEKEKKIIKMILEECNLDPKFFNHAENTIYRVLFAKTISPLILTGSEFLNIFYHSDSPFEIVKFLI